MRALSTIDRFADLKQRWREDLASGVVWTETDGSFYKREAAAKRIVEASMMDIAHATAHYFGISRAELFCSRQANKFAHPRFAAMHLIRCCLPQRTVSEIGRFFKRDHTTVGNALTRAKEMMVSDPDFAKAVVAIRAKLE